MTDQRNEIRGYLRLLKFLRKNSWLIPVSRHLQKLFSRDHIVVQGDKFYQEVLESLEITPQRQLLHYKHELIENELLRRNYLKAIDEGRFSLKYETYEHRFDNEANVTLFYALIREMKPNVIVETGTASGSMTSWLLAALKMNGRGRLISIDIPPVKGRFTMDLTIDKEDIGYLIPCEYSEIWEYIVSDSRETLPSVLINDTVDVFFHDSLHTRSHMLYEYTVAHCLMKADKVILSDDILWNKAWFQFLDSNNLTGLSCTSNPNLGFTINKFDEYETGVGTDVARVSAA